LHRLRSLIAVCGIGPPSMGFSASKKGPHLSKLKMVAGNARVEALTELT